MLVDQPQVKVDTSKLGKDIINLKPHSRPREELLHLLLSSFSKPAVHLSSILLTSISSKTVLLSVISFHTLLI